MGHPVVHFEVIGRDGEKLQRFYGEVFDWKIDASNPMNYGIVDNGGEGINGGIGAAQPGGNGHLTFYVAVDDLDEHLRKIEAAGGSTVMPPTEIPGMLTFALFSDPEGNVVGLVKNG